jgi:hypothetical protein
MANCVANLDKWLSLQSGRREGTEAHGGGAGETFSRGAERLRRVRVCIASANQ